MYASSTAGLFYFMNRNISRDNWTRGAATTKLSAYGAVCLPRAIPYRTNAPPPHSHRIASYGVASRRVASRPGAVATASPPRWQGRRLSWLCNADFAELTRKLERRHP